MADMISILVYLLMWYKLWRRKNKVAVAPEIPMGQLGQGEARGKVQEDGRSVGSSTSTAEETVEEVVGCSSI